MDKFTHSYQIETTEPKAKEHFRQLLSENHIPASKVTIKLLPDSSVNGNVIGIVNLSVANLRTTPRNQAELATQVLLGTPVDLLQKKDGYFRIRTPEGYISWVSASSITPKSKSELHQWKTARKVIFTADFGHSYVEPDEKSLRVSDLVMGNILTLEDESAGFVKVGYPDGRMAYIKNEQARPFDEWLGTLNPTPENILATAKTMMGLPYLWGGTSVKGVDCSGFTKTAYYMNGVIIPRDASQQVLAGQPVDILSADTLDTAKALKNLQPADLLFFASGENRAPDARITHVALYLGNGEFIHAAGTVRINSMLSQAPNYDDFQSRTLVAARRYLGQVDIALRPIALHPAYASPDGQQITPTDNSKPHNNDR
ncbi:C40 family peptidase [Parapedobacter tibetensis]|uniref:C40 family peptidase n=1 Tax=Parapedobacter tibetensis TaxID=2972951 RepID=UPI00214DC135|nr:C40 family peptidase [Parapedobacter tibetensis]